MRRFRCFITFSAPLASLFLYRKDTSSKAMSPTSLPASMASGASFSGGSSIISVNRLKPVVPA